MAYLVDCMLHREGSCWVSKWEVQWTNFLSKCLHLSCPQWNSRKRLVSWNIETGEMALRMPWVKSLPIPPLVRLNWLLRLLSSKLALCMHVSVIRSTPLELQLASLFSSVYSVLPSSWGGARHIGTALCRLRSPARLTASWNLICWFSAKGVESFLGRKRPANDQVAFGGSKPIPRSNRALHHSGFGGVKSRKTRFVESRRIYSTHCNVVLVTRVGMVVKGC